MSVLCKPYSSVCVSPCWISALIHLLQNLQDNQSFSAKEVALLLENPSSQLLCHCLYLENCKAQWSADLFFFQSEKNNSTIHSIQYFRKVYFTTSTKILLEVHNAQYSRFTRTIATLIKLSPVALISTIGTV